MAIIFNFAYSIYIVTYPTNLLGIIILLLGLYLSKKGSDQFQKADTNINTFDEPDKLITNGLFKYTRNPMYLGFAISLLGVAVILGTIQSLIIFIFFIMITDQWYIKFEEQMMVTKFGSEYKSYMKRTRKWL